MSVAALYIVQYVPDPVRDERLNVGVILYCAEVGFLGCLLTKNLQRVKQFHPQADLEFLNLLQDYFDRRIAEHADDPGSLLDEIRHFSNMIQIGPPSFMFDSKSPRTNRGLLFALRRLDGRPRFF